MQVQQVRGLQTPLDFRIAPQRAGTGARGVHQNAVELGGEGQRLGAVQHYTRAVQIDKLVQAMPMYVARYGLDAILERLGCFVARGSAQIEEGLASVQIEKRNNGLRPDILNATSAGDVCFGRLQKGSGDRLSRVRSELAVPLFKQ